MKKKILVLFSFFFLLVVAIATTYYLMDKKSQSLLNFQFFVDQTREIKSIVSVLQHGEAHFDKQAFEELDCDVYATLYSRMKALQSQIDNSDYYLGKGDKKRATDSLNEALKVLDEYKNRNGQKTCESAYLIVNWVQ